MKKVGLRTEMSQYRSKWRLTIRWKHLTYANKQNKTKVRKKEIARTAERDGVSETKAVCVCRACEISSEYESISFQSRLRAVA